MRGKSGGATSSASPTTASFNEARALCAGSRSTSARSSWRGGCFNEARALCAGSRAEGGLQTGRHPALQ